MTGLFCGLVFMTWLSLNAQAAIASGHIDYETKPLSAEGCDYLFNATSSTEEPIIEER